MVLLQVHEGLLGSGSLLGALFHQALHAAQCIAPIRHAALQALRFTTPGAKCSSEQQWPCCITYQFASSTLSVQLCFCSGTLNLSDLHMYILQDAVMKVQERRGGEGRQRGREGRGGEGRGGKGRGGKGRDLLAGCCSALSGSVGSTLLLQAHLCCCHLVPQRCNDPSLTHLP